MRRSPLPLLLALGTIEPAWAASHYQVLNRPEDTLYFGRVVHCDLGGGDLDPRVFRDGRFEPATVNTPLVPGDRLMTPAERRCEIAFDTGTVAFLDGGTTVLLEALLAPSLSSRKKLTNLVLESSGRIRVRYRPYGRLEVFQVLTANAAVKVEGGAFLDVAAEGGTRGTRLVAEEGRATVLFGPHEARTWQARLEAGEAVRILADHSLDASLAGSATVGDPFRTWSRERQEARVQRAPDARPLPATLKDLPPAVLDFGERMSRAHGEWVWTRAKAHAWRPHESRKPGWRPHRDGRWTVVQGMPFWVSAEDWGWVPYHLGYWLDDADAGWVWLPGSTFAPAWVAWAGCGDSLGWRPFGPEDWWLYRRGAYPLLPSCDVEDGAWYNDPWIVDAAQPPARPQEYAKRRGSGPGPEPPPHRPRPEREGPPRELRTMRTELDRLAERLGPESTGASAGRRAVFPEVLSEAVPRRERTERRDPETAEGSGSRAPSASSAAAAPEAPAFDGFRFRDWNPDVRAAREQGGHISYDSALNRISCEGCPVRNGRYDLSGSDTGRGWDAGGGASSSSSASSGSSGSASAAASGGGGAAATTHTSPIDR